MKSEQREAMKRPFWKELFNRFVQDDAGGLAAQLAYYFLLSLFPLLIFLVTLLDYLPFTQGDLMSFIAQYAPGETTEIINKNLNEIMGKHNGGLLSLGIIGTLWPASNGINAIVRAFNRAYDVEETRHFLVARSMSVLLTVGMVLVILVALLLPVFGREIGLFFFAQVGLSVEFLKTWTAIRWVLSSVILFIVFTSLYYFAPNKHILFMEAVPGAFFSTFGWMFVSLGFSYYVSSIGNYTATYGSLGGIIIMMVWLYLSGLIIIVGGEINAILYKAAGSDEG